MTTEQTLEHAHRLLRKGQVEAAITAYTTVLEARPDHWTAANRLGDLFVQTDRLPEAVDQFTRVAQHLLDKDLLPKAAALYKKVLKIAPDDEGARVRLAEVAERQGFLAEARSHLETVAAQRRRAGDEVGAQDIARKVASIKEPETEPILPPEPPGQTGDSVYRAAWPEPASPYQPPPEAAETTDAMTPVASGTWRPKRTFHRPKGVDISS